MRGWGSCCNSATINATPLTLPHPASGERSNRRRGGLPPLTGQRRKEKPRRKDLSRRGRTKFASRYQRKLMPVLKMFSVLAMFAVKYVVDHRLKLMPDRTTFLPYRN